MERPQLAQPANALLVMAKYKNLDSARTKARLHAVQPVVASWPLDQEGCSARRIDAGASDDVAARKNAARKNAGPREMGR
jgi:hypothetical protein